MNHGWRGVVIVAFQHFDRGCEVDASGEGGAPLV